MLPLVVVTCCIVASLVFLCIRADCSSPLLAARFAHFVYTNAYVLLAALGGPFMASWLAYLMAVVTVHAMEGLTSGSEHTAAPLDSLRVYKAMKGCDQARQDRPSKLSGKIAEKPYLETNHPQCTCKTCLCVQQIHLAGNSSDPIQVCSLGTSELIHRTQRKLAQLCEFQNLYNEYFGSVLVTLMLHGIVHMVQALFVVTLLLFFPGTPSLSSPVDAFVTEVLVAVAATTLVAVICDVATPVTDEVPGAMGPQGLRNG